MTSTTLAARKGRSVAVHAELEMKQTQLEKPAPPRNLCLMRKQGGPALLMEPTEQIALAPWIETDSEHEVLTGPLHLCKGLHAKIAPFLAFHFDSPHGCQAPGLSKCC